MNTLSEKVKTHKIFQNFAPKRKIVIAKEQLIISADKLERIEMEYTERSEVMPLVLQKAINDEKDAFNKKMEQEEEDEDDNKMMDLSMFLDDGDDDKLEGKRRDDLGEEIYN